MFSQKVQLDTPDKRASFFPQKKTVFLRTIKEARLKIYVSI